MVFPHLPPNLASQLPCRSQTIRSVLDSRARMTFEQSNHTPYPFPVDFGGFIYGSVGYRRTVCQPSEFMRLGPSQRTTSCCYGMLLLMKGARLGLGLGLVAFPGSPTSWICFASLRAVWKSVWRLRHLNRHPLLLSKSTNSVRTCNRRNRRHSLGTVRPIPQPHSRTHATMENLCKHGRALSSSAQ